MIDIDAGSPPPKKIGANQVKHPWWTSSLQIQKCGWLSLFMAFTGEEKTLLYLSFQAELHRVGLSVTSEEDKSVTIFGNNKKGPL